MNQLQIFENPEFGAVRTVELNGEPWLVGKDVAQALGYERATKAIQDHVDTEDKGVVPIQDSIGRMQKTPVINESGLYSLVLSSKLPTARKFRHWVTSEVLPSIRRHGLYAADELLNNPDLMIQAMEALKSERAKNQQLTEKVRQDAPKVLFAESVEASNRSILIFDLAKILRQNGVQIGGNRLFEWMRENSYLIKRKGSDWNMPTQRSMEWGCLRSRSPATSILTAM